jgi:hypothetical protein
MGTYGMPTYYTKVFTSKAVPLLVIVPVKTVLALVPPTVMFHVSAVTTPPAKVKFPVKVPEIVVGFVPVAAIVDVRVPLTVYPVFES